MTDTCKECERYISLYSERYYVLDEKCEEIVCNDCYKAIGYYPNTGEFQIVKRIDNTRKYKAVQVGY